MVATVGVADEVQKLLQGRQGLRHNAGIRSAQRPFLPLHGDDEAVHLIQQIGDIGGDEVDHAQLERTGVGGGGRFLHGRDSPLDRLLAATRGQVLDIGAEDVYDLRLHRVADVLPLAADGAGRADAAAGRHGGNVPGEGDKGAGAAGLGRGRGDVYHHRHRRSQHVLHDLLGDFDAAAGGVQAQDYRLGPLQLRVFDCPAEILTQNRRHGPAER